MPRSPDPPTYRAERCCLTGFSDSRSDEEDAQTQWPSQSGGQVLLPPSAQALSSRLESNEVGQDEPTGYRGTPPWHVDNRRDGLETNTLEGRHQFAIGVFVEVHSHGPLEAKEQAHIMWSGVGVWRAKHVFSAWPQDRTAPTEVSLDVFGMQMFDQLIGDYGVVVSATSIASKVHPVAGAPG